MSINVNDYNNSHVNNNNIQGPMPVSNYSLLYQPDTDQDTYQ